MKIHKLVIKNFRGFPDLTLELQGKSAIFVGKNGAGKSSLLDAVAVGFSIFVSRMRTKNANRRLTDSDITNQTNQVSIELFVEHGEQHLSWGITKLKDKGVKFFKPNNSMKALVDSLLGNPLFEKKGMGCLPLIAYYPVNRTMLGALQKATSDASEFNQLSAYERSLTSGADFQTFLDWYHLRENFENELKIANREFDLVDPQLEAVRQAIYAFLPGFSNLRVSRNPLQLLINKGTNKTLELSQLSDGEKCLLALVGDLARRLSLANPDLSEPTKGQGVVMIDEIELHLHPEWQRNVIPRLRDTFPNIQFLISTHSPQVLGEVQDMLIFQLTHSETGNEVNPHPTVFGKDSNRILEDVFGSVLRNQSIKNKIREMFDAITDGRWQDARDLQEDLREQIGHDEPELVKADVLYRRKRSLEQ